MERPAEGAIVETVPELCEEKLATAMVELFDMTLTSDDDVVGYGTMIPEEVPGM